MPLSRHSTTGYERIAQADALCSDSEDDDPLTRSTATLQPAAAPRYAPISQPRPHSGMHSPKAFAPRPKPHRRGGSGSGVDLKAINARLERWADEIASRFKRNKGVAKNLSDEEPLEIHHSVFQPPEGVRPLTAEGLAEPQPDVMTKAEFEDIISSVRAAIAQGVHPRMISQGSSGSYFARNPEGKVVGVFKPKDEEPYAAGNPKWNKWIHRNLFPCFFGRACLIPNLSYVSEAAAYTLDCQLRTHIVPYTDVVWLSSKSFHYPFWDRLSFRRKKKPLPEKAGSFQVFLKGFKDANVFLREHPWPDQYLSGFRTTDSRRRKRRRWADNCRPGSGPSLNDIESDDEDSAQANTPGPDNFVWTESLKESFREELEKLVILDYIMRNTDRGLDNWMIKVDWGSEQVSIVSEPIQFDSGNGSSSAAEDGPRPASANRKPSPARATYPSYQTQQPMQAASPASSIRDPKITVGAIDNSLSWPWKHPDAWRSFPFGWLFLPVDLIGRPFSQKTRDHFLPLLTSTQWWSQTQLALRKVFQLDPDFQERMFARQMAVMKGQAWNVVETLKLADHGPLELTRRAKVCVWDDLVDIPVAVPMRMSSDLHHRNVEPATFDEEGDIGAAVSSSAPARPPDADMGDLLGFASSPANMPHPGRFELSTSPSTGEGGARSPDGESFVGSSDILNSAAAQLGKDVAKPGAPHRPTAHVASGFGQSPHGRPQTQTQTQTQTLNAYAPDRGQGQGGPAGGKGRRLNHQRRYSFATAATRRSSSTIAQRLYGAAGREHDSEANLAEDDLDGDLGYAAAEGMEGNRRKVIVERLEPVKARNPVFTWC
ncbi:phosphatidylinositol 4-kinase LSB6 [Sodiomyces alkalinus F11]|uniref:Phosphatidylinositol 4-kinase n=1 Tax=Sodiomyces alkalinus (strain CBS 110278 / VKM F-3762 / F11) TaxID=1314773 RepID=A0A3N2PVY1_SODAK|nr:phosphatidylinositol 4-kinase LSB6 [Sodiomyces alkalinus F11]ROT38634.1 phosphatidylinositol 4-kinase LSB6 [Sodiomyces alkalinus F11]